MAYVFIESVTESMFLKMILQNKAFLNNFNPYMKSSAEKKLK